MKNEGKKTYICTLRNGELRKVTVPATWKTTFGPTAPFSGKNTDYNHGLALRFYEGSSKDNLRAVFTDVVAFRDDSLEIQERRTEIKHQTVGMHSPGGMKNAVVEARITQWVNPDTEAEDSRNEQAAAPYLLEMAKNS